MATIVLKLGGSVCLDKAQVQAVAGELRALKAAGHRVVLVHGGGPQLDQALAALGEAVQKVDGLRVTSPAAARVVQEVMDRIGQDLAGQLTAAGVSATHLPSIARWFQGTTKKSPKGDLGRVGSVNRFAAAALPAGEAVPVVTPIAWDAQGPLNVNADEGASAVAGSLQADWLVLATDVAAVRGAEGEPLSRLTPRDARRLIGGAATGGMIPKLTSAVSALSAGVGHVLIAKVQPGVVVDAVLKGEARGTLVEDDLQVAS